MIDFGGLAPQKKRRQVPAKGPQPAPAAPAAPAAAPPVDGTMTFGAMPSKGPQPNPTATPAPPPDGTMTFGAMPTKGPHDNPAGQAGGQTGGQAPAEDTRTVEQMIEDFVRSRLGGEVDTSAEDALIQQQMEAQIGAGRVNNRAAMGRSGFAESGAELAVGADIERAARSQAAQQMLDVRQREEEQAYNEAIGAAGLDIEERQAANEQMLLEAKLQALDALLGSGDGGAVGDKIGDVVDSPPEGAEKVSTIVYPPTPPYETWDVYEDEDGNRYRVKAG